MLGFRVYIGIGEVRALGMLGFRVYIRFRAYIGLRDVRV